LDDYTKLSSKYDSDRGLGVELADAALAAELATDGGGGG
jgi:hypothetical protein